MSTKIRDEKKIEGYYVEIKKKLLTLPAPNRMVI